nr:hypothetical protein [Bacteroidota bacterium]
MTYNIEEITEASFAPAFMRESDGLLYMSDPKHGILIFDQIGQYIETIPIAGIHHFRIDGGQILYHLAGNANAYHLKSKEIISKKLPRVKFRSCTIDIQDKEMVLYMTGQKNITVFSAPLMQK